MKIFNCALNNDAQDTLNTEIRFNVASARASGCEFVCLETYNADKDKILATTAKILQAMKKEGKIDFFATRLDFESNNAKAGYLSNKIANVFEIMSNNNLLLIVKL
jgi:hypothetical protein